MNKYLREAILWVWTLTPMLYLIGIWHELPDSVPTHFGMDGKPNDWSSKSTLFFLVGEMSIGTYLLMLILPKIDPSKRINEMGQKYDSLRHIISFFMMLLGIYILYAAKAGELSKPQYLIAIVAALLAMMGNYFQTLRPNYFIGIRTPWTMSNENVWKRTHLLAGRLWLAGGLLSLVLSLTMELNTVLLSILGVILFTIVVVPVALSYWYFQKEGTSSK